VTGCGHDYTCGAGDGEGEAGDVSGFAPDTPDVAADCAGAGGVAVDVAGDGSTA